MDIFYLWENFLFFCFLVEFFAYFFFSSRAVSCIMKGENSDKNKVPRGFLGTAERRFQMKLITAIINKKDAACVCDSLTEAGFFFTKLATSGGFLKEGNLTLLIGVDDDRVHDALEVIRLHCLKRTETAPVMTGAEASVAAFSYAAPQVVVGGATVFVTNVEQFEKY